MMSYRRTRDYQLVEEITWKDEFLKPGQPKTSIFKQSYAHYGTAVDAAYYFNNGTVESKTVTIIHKPTGRICLQDVVDCKLPW